MERPGVTKIVVLDPGHGGPDSGALGPTGLREADVVLDVAKRTAEILSEHDGVAVFLTRHRDESVALEDRARFANEHRADVFLSIHCNSAKVPAQGIETWIARETAVSYPLAEAVQESMVAMFPGIADRGVKRANFTVLTHTAMAAALAELRFMHTREGEAALRDHLVLENYGLALAQGVLAFLGIRGLDRPVDPVEPVVCEAQTPADLVEVGKRLGRLEQAVFQEG